MTRQTGSAPAKPSRRNGILVAVAANVGVQLLFVLGLDGGNVGLWDEATFAVAVGTGLTGMVLRRRPDHEALGAGLVTGTLWTVGILVVLGFLLVALLGTSGS